MRPPRSQDDGYEDDFEDDPPPAVPMVLWPFYDVMLVLKVACPVSGVCLA